MKLTSRDYSIKLISIFLIFIFLLLFTSCNRKDNINKGSHIGKMIYFPDSLVLIKKDILLATEQNFYNADNLKVISIIKADCGKCINDFNELNTFLKELDGDFECFFMINTDDFKYFKTHVYPQLDKSFHLLFNQNNCFEKRNKLEGTYNIFNTFIVNNRNEIVFIGNPVHDKYSRNEYINLIVLQNE